MGGVLCARLLWTFSAALRRTGDAVHRGAADHFFAWLSGPFRDPVHGGIYWMLDHEGRPVAARKQTYALAFALYALAEYRLATGSEAALSLAVELFEHVERRATDEGLPGYAEARSREWAPLADVRLSEKDQNAPRSMNTHLHLMEAYASLLREWNDAALRARLASLIGAFQEHIVDPQSFHFRMFFDERLQPKSDHISYGHDIEGSWLLCEAAEILGEHAVLEQIQQVAVKMADAVLREAVDPDGGLLYEADATGVINTDKQWWPQAEAVVGFLNAFQLSGERRFYEAGEKSWTFIEKHIVDRRHGEWFARVSREGIPCPKEDKAGPWKCPYHNSRVCFEAMRRLDSISATRRTVAKNR
jgi:mannobiose 2-epimerase